MLEKLRDNPRAVVAALIAAGIVAVAIGAGSQNGDEADTDQTEQNVPEVIVDEGAGVEADGEAATEGEAAAEEAAAEASEPAAGPVEVSSEEGVLKATVRSGDNQTVIVRQMIDDYLAAQSDTISQEQKLFVETNAVNALPRNDIIHPGEEVALEESAIAQLVEDSKGLDEAAVARWSAYL